MRPPLPRPRASRADRPFVFRHRWSVPRPAPEVMSLLADPLGYPRWWPAISSARDVSAPGTEPGAVGERAAIRLIGLVPVRLTMERVRDDRERGVMIARVDEDLHGTVRVDVRGPGVAGAGAGGPGSSCLVAWTQEVTLGSGWMRGVARIPGARAAMRLSHAAAMRAGRRALGATALPAR